MESNEVKTKQTVSRDRYLRLLEDSAILRQIEFLLDQKPSSDTFLDSVRDIVSEMRTSRNEK